MYVSMCMQVNATCVQVTLEVREGVGFPGAEVSGVGELPKWMVGSKFRLSGSAASAYWSISSAPAMSS